jgi:hypothetical protein
MSESRSRSLCTPELRRLQLLQCNNMLLRHNTMAEVTYLAVLQPLTSHHLRRLHTNHHLHTLLNSSSSSSLRCLRNNPSAIRVSLRSSCNTRHSCRSTPQFISK